MKMKTTILSIGLLFISYFAHATEVSLKTSIIVEEKFITIGDLFNITGKNATKRIAMSPRPGQFATYDARWLYHIARKNGVDWKPFNLNTRAIVERASQQISVEQMHEFLKIELKNKGAPEAFELTTSGRLRQIHVAANQPPTLSVEYLSYEPTTKRFIASLAAPARDPEALRFRVAGKLHKLTEIPVVDRNLTRGQLIRPEHIELLTIRESKIRRDTILTQEEIIGMATKRVIRAGVPIRTSQIMRPLLVEKGDLVTIKLTTPFMRLTTQGKSLVSGSQGETIQVKNIQSKQVVEAKVIGKNEVAVFTFGEKILREGK